MQSEEAQREAEAYYLPDEARCLLAELVGTFSLVFVAAGARVISDLSGEETYLPRVTAPGLMVMAMIYTFGDVSGAHINPAVTLAFALRRAFPWARVPGYVVAQLTGALIAGGLLYAIFPATAHVAAATPHFGQARSLAMEVVLTGFLVTVIIGTATGHKVVGPNAGIAVGATVVLCGMFATPVSGASMNPTVSLGPSIVAGKLAHLWLYIVGPLLGAGVTVALNFLVRGRPRAHEAMSASGEGSKPRAAS